MSDDEVLLTYDQWQAREADLVRRRECAAGMHLPAQVTTDLTGTPIGAASCSCGAITWTPQDNR